MSHLSWLLVFTAAAAVASCSVYGTDLVNTGGAGGSGTSSSGSSTASASSASSASSTSTASSASSASSTSSTSSSGAPPCADASECPGVDTECSQRTCLAGVCGATSTAMGTALQAQTAGDCKKAVCDGNGGITTVNQDTDKLDDGNDCTTDGCAAGTAKHTPVAVGSPCATGGGQVCTAAGKCVECNVGGDCASMVCKTNICVAAQCNDLIENGAETDVDCGGGSCPKCGLGKKCGGDSDCAGQSCLSAHCAATCTDLQKDGAESDIDCGGGTCAACPSGKACGGNADCQSGKCSGSVCMDVLLISELQTRGTAGGSDEFIEIYNPTAVAVKFDSSWEVWARNAATSACSVPNKRITGGTPATFTIPPHGHLLYANSAGYNGTVTPDGTYSSGFTDSGEVILLHGGVVVDSLCYYFNPTTQGNLTCATPPTVWYPCMGTPMSNLPHNDGTGAASTTDVSLERKPGGGAGNGQSTGDNGADFTSMVVANPQNLASAPTP